MELQLGLGLPGNSIKGFDLNSYGNGYEPKDVSGSDSITLVKNSKRSFDEAFEFENFHVPQTLPLLVWNNNNLSDQDDNISDLEPACSIINRNEGEESGVVGWPPVKSWRRKLCHQKHGGGGGGLKSMYVKVKMEGVGIARKVDLSLHGSYQTLTHTLIGMFRKWQEDVKSYKLTYQDKEGDWLLAGDVPWGTFVETVQRLRLLKNAG